jgi:hypothetical protein
MNPVSHVNESLTEFAGLNRERFIDHYVQLLELL